MNTAAPAADTPDAGEASSGRPQRGTPVVLSNAWTENDVVDGANTTPLTYVTAAYDGDSSGWCQSTFPVSRSTACNYDTRPGSFVSVSSTCGPAEDVGPLPLNGSGMADAAKRAGLPPACPTAPLEMKPPMAPAAAGPV